MKDVYDSNTSEEIVNILGYLTANSNFCIWFIEDKELFMNILKCKCNELIVLNLTRNENYHRLPGNYIKEEYSIEDKSELRLLYRTIPGYEFIGEFTNYLTDKTSHIVRIRLIKEFSILELMNGMFKQETEHSDSIKAEIILNLAEENELKPILIQQGYLKRMKDLYFKTKSQAAKIHSVEALARLLINTNPLLSELQVEEYANVLLIVLKGKFSSVFSELLHFECCMALAYLATVSDSASDL
jgi:hypothetical protein